MKEDNLDTAEIFVKRFVDENYHMWEANYTIKSKEELQNTFDKFVKDFYNFQAIIVIGRPTSPSDDWFEEEAKQDLESISKRPIFKIEQYLIDKENIYTAYTGANNKNSSSYYEILIFKLISDEYKVFSIYRPDFEGGRKHVQGEKFKFSKKSVWL